MITQPAMICPKCKTVNDAQYVFCVNCGATLRQNIPYQDIEGESAVPPTVREVRPPVVVNYTPEASDPTVFRPNAGYRGPQHPGFVEQPQAAKRGSAGKIIAAGVAVVVLLGLVGVGVFAFIVWQKATAEAL